MRLRLPPFLLPFRSFWQSGADIVYNEGVFGLFSGLPAKVVCDVSCLVLASSTIYVVQKYMLEKRSNGQLSALVNFVWSSLLYPLQVVSTCMTVTGSQLSIGKPVYRNWLHCYTDLSLAGECKRGSSLFFRYVCSIHITLNIFHVNFPLCSYQRPNPKMIR